jgi:hypothetical protein
LVAPGPFFLREGQIIPFWFWGSAVGIFNSDAGMGGFALASGIFLRWVSGIFERGERDTLIFTRF